MKKYRLKNCLRSDFELLEIGTRIHYHHRAGIARLLTLYPNQHRNYYSDEKIRWGWKIVEGTLVYNGRQPETVPMEDKNGKLIDGWNFNPVREMFFDWPQAHFSKWGYKQCQYNKTVMVWPNDGFGWIMGIMRKSIGVSSRSYGHGEDYEQGYHDTDMYVDLYVVKPWYEGAQYVLCPLWAVQEVKDD